jgi:hypothetical protein
MQVLRYLDERALELESAVAERTKERDALAERVKVHMFCAHYRTVVD